VRPRPRTRLHVELTDGTNVRLADDVGAGFVDACAELVADPIRSARIGLAARDYFDRYLAADQLAGYYLDGCVTKLAG
jgi:hypothetical protein